MNKKSILLLATAAVMALSSCNDFLDDNRYPQSQLVSNPEFWSTPVCVEGECNHFYNNFSGYGSGSGQGTFYFKTLNDDQAGTISSRAADWTFPSTPSSSSYWSDPYTQIRNANAIIEGVAGGSLNGSAEGNNYIAIARLNRGLQYFALVKRYGDVPLVTEVLDPESPELYGPRVNRNTVMDFALDDLQFAIENLSAQSSKTTFSKDMAKAARIEAALFEASYARYHQQDDARAQKYYGEVATLCGDLLDKYPVGDDYAALYRSITDDLKLNGEVIFMKSYKKDIFMHSLLDWTCSSSTVCGITRDAFDSFLFIDGKPLASTTENTTDVGVDVSTADQKAFSIANLLAVRDKRLSVDIDDHLMYIGMTYTRVNTMAMASHTGYGVAKFDNLDIEYDYATVANKAYTAAPLYWGARIVMAYAEAKAELGTIDDTDMAYVNKLYKRAGLPDQTVASLTAIDDPANNMGVSSLLWEIRRCRRCEFMFDDDIRYWDLVRWHQLELLDYAKNPKITQGANITGVPVMPQYYEGDYITCKGVTDRTFAEREYLWPIPSEQLSLNPALKPNNPGWD